MCQAVTGPNELVAVGDKALPAGLLELQQKLKYVYHTFATRAIGCIMCMYGCTMCMYM